MFIHSREYSLDGGQKMLRTVSSAMINGSFKTRLMVVIHSFNGGYNIKPDYYLLYKRTENN